jgi:TPR repeat protein
LAAEFFQQASDQGNLDGLNSLGVCLEVGEAREANPIRAFRYYRHAATGCHPAGLYNAGRCFEYGKGVSRDYFRAAKYYRLSTDFGHGGGENRFGECLERGLGVQENQTLAADYMYYRRSANHGNADGANNYGFCLEHGRGVAQNIALAGEYSRFAADHGHSEGEVNYERCLRLLGRWTVQDLPSDVCFHRPSRDDLIGPFLADLDDRCELAAAWPDLLSSIERLKQSQMISVRFAGGKSDQLEGVEIGRSDSSIVTFDHTMDGALAAATTARNRESAELIEQAAMIHERLKHPHVIEFREFRSGTASWGPTTITEFAGNGSLASHLTAGKGRLLGSDRIARIVVGIVLGMRYLHGAVLFIAICVLAISGSIGTGMS